MDGGKHTLLIVITTTMQPSIIKRMQIGDRLCVAQQSPRLPPVAGAQISNREQLSNRYKQVMRVF